MVALERLFAMTSRGAALINRIKADGDQRTVRSVCTHNNQCVLSIYSRTQCVVTGAPG